MIGNCKQNSLKIVNSADYCPCVLYRMTYFYKAEPKSHKKVSKSCRIRHFFLLYV